MNGNIIKRQYKVDGMSCKSCENTIIKVLALKSGVIKATASYEGSWVEVEYDKTKIGEAAIIKAIENAGYVARALSNETSDKFNINQLLAIGAIIFALYLIINNTVGFNFIPQVTPSMGYGILFIVGILTSLHCIAMCGGISVSQCIAYKNEDGAVGSKLKPSILYNLGRVISYTVIGGIVGAIGSVVSFSGMAKGAVAILAGIFMVIMGLNMLNIFPWLRRLNPHIPNILGNKVLSSSKKHGPLYVGLLNGLMPCGPLQAMQIYALGTGSFFIGALSMFFFSIGTVPLMFGLGAISTFLGSRFTHKMLKTSAILVVVLGVIMVSRGINLSGIKPVSASVANNSSIAKIEGNIQVVSTKLESGDYYPIVVQKGIPVKWTITAKQDELNGCNNPLTIPKYNIEKRLVPGDNIIEFTPTTEGDITYTCWMGMISSNIKVVADVSKASEKDSVVQTEGNSNTKATVQERTSSQTSSGGCCGKP